jgi:hypothetical protein
MRTGSYSAPVSESLRSIPLCASVRFYLSSAAVCRATDVRDAARWLRIATPSQLPWIALQA